MLGVSHIGIVTTVGPALTRLPASIATIAFAAARMTQAFKKQGISRDTIPFRAPFAPWVQYFSSFFCSVIILFSGFSVFLKGNWSTSDFFANYISEFGSKRLVSCKAHANEPLFAGLFLYIVPYIGYKIIKKTKVSLDSVSPQMFRTGLLTRSVWRQCSTSGAPMPTFSAVDCDPRKSSRKSLAHRWLDESLTDCSRRWL